eukprot:348582-Pleurochrysis_carterae.AAC.2
MGTQAFDGWGGRTGKTGGLPFAGEEGFHRVHSTSRPRSKDGQRLGLNAAKAPHHHLGGWEGGLRQLSPPGTSPTLTRKGRPTIKP